MIGIAFMKNVIGSLMQKNGEKTLFYKYFKDYQSIEDVKRILSFSERLIISS